MLSLASHLAPLLLGGILGWTGAAKLFGRATARAAAGTPLARILRGDRRAALAMRTLGAVELLVTAALLVLPTAVVPGTAAVVLGAGFLGYLGYARVTAPQSSCGCTARDDTPITWRTFTRAGLVTVIGVAAAASTVPWWTAIGQHPLASPALLVAGAAVLLVLSAELDHMWLLPLRRLRLRVFGHPLGWSGAEVPVAASVELLENSLAWHAASPIVRSALLDHWDDSGWRVLEFAGVHDGDGGARPVSVLFALDAGATLATTRSPAVRLSVIDAETGETVAVRLPSSPPPERVVPLAT